MSLPAGIMGVLELSRAEHVEQLRNNKLSYTVASCWSLSYIISWCTQTWISWLSNMVQLTSAAFLPSCTACVCFWTVFEFIFHHHIYWSCWIFSTWLFKWKEFGFFTSFKNTSSRYILQATWSAWHTKQKSLSESVWHFSFLLYIFRVLYMLVLQVIFFTSVKTALIKHRFHVR